MSTTRMSTLSFLSPTDNEPVQELGEGTILFSDIASTLDAELLQELYRNKSLPKVVFPEYKDLVKTNVLHALVAIKEGLSRTMEEICADTNSLPSLGEQLGMELIPVIQLTAQQKRYGQKDVLEHVNLLFFQAVNDAFKARKEILINEMGADFRIRLTASNGEFKGNPTLIARLIDKICEAEGEVLNHFGRCQNDDALRDALSYQEFIEDYFSPLYQFLRGRKSFEDSFFLDWISLFEKARDNITDRARRRRKTNEMGEKHQDKN